MVKPHRGNVRSRYLALILGTGLLALAGYAFAARYPRFHLPAESGAALLPLAGMAAVASCFSPCSFPLLLTLLGRATRAESGERTLWPALRFAAALSIGAGLFLLLAGGALSLGAGPIFQKITFASPAGRALRAAVGVVLILLALVQLGKLPNVFDRTWRLVEPLMRTQARLRRSNPTLAFGLYGFVYILAGFG